MTDLTAETRPAQTWRSDYLGLSRDELHPHLIAASLEALDAWRANNRVQLEKATPNLRAKRHAASSRLSTAMGELSVILVAERFSHMEAEKATAAVADLEEHGRIDLALRPSRDAEGGAS